jgi:hypothetical protein
LDFKNLENNFVWQGTCVSGRSKAGGGLHGIWSGTQQNGEPREEGRNENGNESNY